MSLLREACKEASLSTLCGLFGYSRQSYYKRDDNDFAEDAIEPLIVEKAQSYRKDNPGLGCSKLYLIVKKLFEENECMPGRDAFIEIWVADITYVETDEGVCYLSLITDAYSHKITIVTRDECRAVLERIIGFYNTQRPHMSIGMQTPEEAHGQSGQQRRCWKNGWAVA